MDPSTYYAAVLIFLTLAPIYHEEYKGLEVVSTCREEEPYKYVRLEFEDGRIECKPVAGMLEIDEESENIEE